MNDLRNPIRIAVLTLLAASAAHAQSTPASPAQDPTVAPLVVHHPHPLPPKPEVVNFNLILLDPGHGGTDNGAMFPPEYGIPVAEKDVTLALANRVADHLKAQGFTVVLTRTNSTDDVPLEARVELANHTRPLACILLHAANAGHGMHLYTSSLTPASAAPDPNLIIPWDTAQAASLAQSLRLSNDLSSALNVIRVPLVTGRASILPIDSLSCPAVELEIAPLAPSGDINTPVTDPAYQTHVAEAITSAMGSWRGHAQAMAAAAAAQAAAAQAAKPPAPEPKPKPRKPATPKPAVNLPAASNGGPQ